MVEIEKKIVVENMKTYRFGEKEVSIKYQKTIKYKMKIL